MLLENVSVQEEGCMPELVVGIPRVTHLEHWGGAVPGADCTLSGVYL